MTPEQYQELAKMNPDHRLRERTSDLVNDRIVSALILFGKRYDMRNGWIDPITYKEAKEEILQLIIDCGGDPNTKRKEKLDSKEDFLRFVFNNSTPL
jgi:hypothetical protein